MYSYSYNQYYQQYQNYYAQWGYDQNTGSYSYSYPQYGYTQSTMQVTAGGPAGSAGLRSSCGVGVVGTGAWASEKKQGKMKQVFVKNKAALSWARCSRCCSPSLWSLGRHMKKSGMTHWKVRKSSFTHSSVLCRVTALWRALCL